MNSSNPAQVPLDYKFESIDYPNTIFMTRKMRALVRNEKLMNELKDLKKIANKKSRVLSNQEFNELKVWRLLTVNLFTWPIISWVWRFACPCRNVIQQSKKVGRVAVQRQRSSYFFPAWDQYF